MMLSNENLVLMKPKAPAAILPSTARKTAWHLITGEYPDQIGGVSDYTRQLAIGLAAEGEEVNVWAPSFRGKTPHDPGVEVHRLAGRFDLRSLRFLNATLNDWPGRSRILVQYVPHAYGWKAMNIPFCRWLRRRRQPVWVMFHEVAFPRVPGQSLKHRVLNKVTEWMASEVSASAERVFVSIPEWQTRLQQFAAHNDHTYWLPIFSNLPTSADANAVAVIRRSLSPSKIVGHFGTYGESITRLLTPLLQDLLGRNPSIRFMFIGRGGEEYAKNFKDYGDRVYATGSLSPAAVSEHISACEVMLQPFPDGVSCRRGTIMASLALGRAIVTTIGFLSEPFWRDCDAVASCAPDEPQQIVTMVEQLLTSDEKRGRLEIGSQQFYTERFSLQKTIDVLLEKSSPPAFPETSDHLEARSK